MAVRLFESNLSSVAPELRPYYVADIERGYRLDLIDLADHDHGLKNALAVERQTVREQKIKIQELTRLSEVVSLGGE